MAKKSAIRQHERTNASTKDPKTHTYTTTTYPASTASLITTIILTPNLRSTTYTPTTPITPGLDQKSRKVD